MLPWLSGKQQLEPDLGPTARGEAWSPGRTRRGQSAGAPGFWQLPCPLCPRALPTLGSHTSCDPTLLSSSFLESRKSRELPLHMGRCLCFIGTMFPW